MTDSAPPSVAAVKERAAIIANEAMHTVALQVRRLATKEPEDETFILRWWADLQFLVVALRRLRRAAELGAKADDGAGSMHAAIAAFDTELPALTVMRNVGEHIDDYALDSSRRRYKYVDRRQLQVGTWDGQIYRWLRDDDEQWLELDVQKAREAAEKLYMATRRSSVPD